MSSASLQIALRMNLFAVCQRRFFPSASRFSFAGEPGAAWHHREKESQPGGSVMHAHSFETKAGATINVAKIRGMCHSWRSSVTLFRGRINNTTSLPCHCHVGSSYGESIVPVNLSAEWRSGFQLSGFKVIGLARFRRCFGTTLGLLSTDESVFKYKFTFPGEQLPCSFITSDYFGTELNLSLNM